MLSLAKATLLWTGSLTIACMVDFSKRMKGYKKKK